MVIGKGVASTEYVILYEYIQVGYLAFADSRCTNQFHNLSELEYKLPHFIFRRALNHVPYKDWKESQQSPVLDSMPS